MCILSNLYNLIIVLYLSINKFTMFTISLLKKFTNLKMKLDHILVRMLVKVKIINL